MLEVERLCAGYGILPVLREISFGLGAGEILLIAGENGAGKTTLMRSIAGLIAPSSGSVRLEGEELAGQPCEQVVRRGLRLVLDGHRVFPGLSVRDNLRLGAAAHDQGRAALAESIERIFTIFPALAEKRQCKARELSGGQQQMLALGQAFVCQPRVLLCDEPSLGLAMALLPPIMAFFREWARQGTAIVIVEQHLDQALAIADRAMLLERGSLRFACPAAQFRRRLAEAA